MLRTSAVVLPLVTILCAACCAPSFEEHISPLTCTYRDHTKPEYLPAYFIRDVPKLPVDSVHLLRQYLERRCWPAALKTYVRNYQPSLPAWIIYISRDTVEQGLIANDDTSMALAEQRYVWAFVFSDVPLSRVGKTDVDAAIRDSARANTPVRRAVTGGGKVQFLADTGKRRYLRDTVRLARDAATKARAAARSDSIAAAAAKARLREHPHNRKLADAAREAADRAASSLSAATVAAAAEKATSDKLLDVESQTAFDSTAYVAESTYVDAAMLKTRAADAVLSAVADTTDLRFSRRTVLYKRNPVIVGVALGLLKALGITAPVDSGLADSLQVLNFRQASADPADPIYVAFSRFGLAENTAAALSVSPVHGKEFSAANPPHITGVYSNVSNARKHRLEIGGMAAISPGPSLLTYDTLARVASQTPGPLFNGYVALYFSPWFISHVPFQEPWQLASLGFFGGTNVLNGSMGDQLIVGMSAGHLLGDGGLDVGLAFVPTQRLVDTTANKPAGAGNVRLGTRTSKLPRLLIGTDIRF